MASKVSKTPGESPKASRSIDRASGSSFASVNVSSSGSMTDSHDNPLPLKPLPSKPKARSKHKASLSITVPRNIDLPLSTFSSTLTAVDQSAEPQNAYPNGPVLVYEPNIYLYSEPDADVLKDYDVVINVAKEVCYPFRSKTLNVSNVSNVPKTSCSAKDAADTANTAVMSPGYPSSSILDSWIPPYDSKLCDTKLADPPRFAYGSTATASNASSTSSCSSSSISSSSGSGNSSPLSDDCAFLNHYQSSDTHQLPPLSENSKQLPTKPPDLEYVYVPWDHGSDLIQDLEPLTNLIALRSLQDKRILIHCQCGVSRSASLIVAYVMKQQQCDLHTAYSYVKNRSPTISPNMKLMYQLMDWDRSIRYRKRGKRASTT